MLKKSTLIAVAFAACFSSFAITASASGEAGSQQPGHLRLIAELDRKDGYCVDIPGSGPNLRPDMPLTAHNCKPGLYADEAVVLAANGRILLPAVRGCMTVMGLNGRAVAGASLMARQCGESTPFMEAKDLQRFELHPDGRLVLSGSGLCLTVGEQSDSTFEVTHRWRSLYMAKCEAVDHARSRWMFSVPKE